jgi:hypothetical protein
MFKNFERRDRIIAASKTPLKRASVGGFAIIIDRICIKTAVPQQTTQQAITSTEIERCPQLKNLREQ